MSEERGPYVVDEDDLGCLHDYLVAAINGDDISELPRLWNQELGVIRSRPLSEEILKAREDVLDEVEVGVEKSISEHPQRIVNRFFREDLFHIIKHLRDGAP